MRNLILASAATAAVTATALQPTLVTCDPIVVSATTDLVDGLNLVPMEPYFGPGFDPAYAEVTIIGINYQENNFRPWCGGFTNQGPVDLKLHRPTGLNPPPGSTVRITWQVTYWR